MLRQRIQKSILIFSVRLIISLSFDLHQNYYSGAGMTFLVPAGGKIMRFDVMPVVTEKQLIEVEEAAKNVWHNYYRDIFSQEQIEYMLEKFQSRSAMKEQMKNGYIYYMLLSDEELAGYMCLHLKGDYVYLERLYIKAEFRRRGLARRTISHIDSVFRNPEIGFSYIKKMRLRVERKNSFAINVYEHLDFHKVKPVDTDIGGGFVCQEYIMERKIPTN